MSGICTGVEQLQRDIDTILVEVLEIEGHLHTLERWLGLGALDTLTPYVITSGNNAYGTEVLLLDVGDTPIQAGKVKFDPHRIKVVDFSDNDIYKIQLTYGAGTFVDAMSAGQYSELMIIAGASVGGASGGGPAEIKMIQLPIGTKIWARCWNSHNADTVSIFLGIHEYDV